ncbi:hypothetical protein AVEN_35672-1 [Araneus ventricosus]|uniref:Uncharacterized protein n=1 Tax=Araneus ventricosus TaxID=182803 RepID=A0A4Y2GC41_ARAVE|nr:hypothetical protein AVEN_35672-1 [Araneus ventricosus]
MADNWLFLCSSVPSALLSWPRCAIIANRLFLCSSVSSALLCWLRCPITANRLFLCSVSSALLSYPRCAMSDRSSHEPPNGEARGRYQKMGNNPGKPFR